MSRTFLRRLATMLTSVALAGVTTPTAAAARPPNAAEARSVTAAATRPAIAPAARPITAAATRPITGAARPAGEKAGPLRVMPLGDSITFGIGSRNLDGYRAALRRWLGADGVAVDYVGSVRSGTGPDRDNEGHPGWTVAQLAERVDGWLATYRPDVVLLHIGTNDMVRGVPDAPRQLDRLLDRIAAARPGAEVFVARIVGIADYREVGTRVRRTTAYNAAVARIVAGKGARFHLVDQSGVRGIDMWNREHPNDFGYRKMAWNWYRAMRPAGAAAGDPYRARQARRCIRRTSLDPAARGCHIWYRTRTGTWRTRVTAGWITAGQGARG